ncbi:MAG: glycosyl hydrolase [Anaerolineaceae bacterium]|nr:glycosyl hydrolase [Anaerolineaceae bacterium]
MSKFPNHKIYNSLIILFCFSVVVVSALFSIDLAVHATEPEPYYEPIDRFGITAPYPSGVETLIEKINARAVLDWGIENYSLTLPDYVEYIHVIRVNDTAWGNGALLSTLPDIIERNPGVVWIIGNEPDRYYYQDSVTAEVYAQRYYDIATLIRTTDTSAKIGFGSVVQPTPIRIRYLNKALDELETLANNRAEAMDLIDIWSIHAFILNEHPDFSWGAGVPMGFESDYYDAIKITDYSDTYSIEIFSQRIFDFRTWMNSIGEREKPLWITEYGSLFPDLEIVCPGCNDGWPTEEDTKNYMINTFNYLVNARDLETGLLEDDNHLVQRWFWYSLNDYRYNFGGSLFDPENNYQITMAGTAFKNYTNYLLSDKVYLPLVNK